MKQYSSFIKEYMNFHVITGYALMVVSTLLCIMAYSGLAYKNGPVIESLGYLLVMLFSAVFLSEQITKNPDKPGFLVSNSANSGLSFFNQLCESFFIGNSEFSKHFSVEIDAAELESVHEC